MVHWRWVAALLEPSVPEKSSGITSTRQKGRAKGCRAGIRLRGKGGREWVPLGTAGAGHATKHGRSPKFLLPISKAADGIIPAEGGE